MEVELSSEGGLSSFALRPSRLQGCKWCEHEAESSISHIVTLTRLGR